MTISACTFAFLVFGSFVFSAIVGFSICHFVNVNLKKFDKYGTSIGFASSLATISGIVLIITLNFEGREPCGKDTVSKVLKSIPVAVIPCDCEK